MTSRQKFERFCKRRKLLTGRFQEVTRDGPRSSGYADAKTQTAWLAWEASRRAFT